MYFVDKLKHMTKKWNVVTKRKKRKATETQKKLHTFAKGSHNESKVKENDQSEIQKKSKHSQSEKHDYHKQMTKMMRNNMTAERKTKTQNPQI